MGNQLENNFALKGFDGNSLTECVKRLLDRDDVPEFANPYCECAGGQFDELCDYLGRHGLAVIKVKSRPEMAISHNAMYLLLVSTSDGDMHCVLCRNGVIVFDTARERRLIYWPEFYYFIVKKFDAAEFNQRYGKFGECRERDSNLAPPVSKTAGLDNVDDGVCLVANGCN
ncbi:MAG: hypothetical protein BWY68_00303 [bacterium ADurb.Bin400]|nr:MAG: hypothetical protein BWY68_00303 [bacterium ADurb.Bin400]